MKNRDDIIKFRNIPFEKSLIWNIFNKVDCYYWYNFLIFKKFNVSITNLFKQDYFTKCKMYELHYLFTVAFIYL